MSRSAPPMGQTETPGWVTAKRSPNLSKKLVKASEEVCPDVVEFAATLGRPVSPSELVHLQRMYDMAMTAGIEREEFAAVLTKIVGRKGSVPVDVMGDSQARSIDKERAA